MKKILILISFLILGIGLSAQNDEADELTLRDSMMIYKNAIKSTIIEVLTDGTVRLKNIADPINDSDGVNKLWVLNQGGVTAVDSSSLNPANAELYLWKGGVAVDTTELDIGYFAVGDLADYVPLSGAGTIYVTPSQLNDSIASASPNTVFPITLPVNGTLSGSVTAAIEGTDYPTGWVLTANGSNLEVVHNLGRDNAGITVYYNISGITYKMMQAFGNGYSGVTMDDDSFIIEGLTNFYTQYKVKIKIFLE
jgi:hypothetical protein